jgi:hypothetical protein
MSRLWRVRMDGAEVPAPDFVFGRRDPNGQPGLMTYLPIDALPSGRHVIEVDALLDLPGGADPGRSAEANQGSDPTQGASSGQAPATNAEWRTYYIPFWK